MRLKRYSVILIGLTVISLSCFKRPKLQTEITIPLLSRKLRVTELLDSNFFRINPDSSIDLFYEARIDTFRVNDSLKIFELHDTVNLTLSDFIIEDLISSTLSLTLGDIGINLPETIIPVPPFDTTLFGLELGLGGIDNLNIVEMVLELQISNFTQLSFDSFGLNLQEIGDFDFGTINPEQTITRRERIQQISLDDSIILMDINISSPGSPVPIRVSRHDSLRIKLVIDSLRISSGTFRVPAHGMAANRQGICRVPSNFQVHIDSLRFLSGDLALTLENQFPCSIRTFIHLREFDFDSTVILPARTRNIFNLDFSGRSYINPNPESTFLNCSTEVIVESSAQPIRFESTDFLSVSYLFTNPKISIFVGSIYDTIKSQMRPKTINFNFPRGLHHINAQNAELAAEIISGLEFPVIFYLKLEADNDYEEQLAIDTLIEIQPGSPSLPRTTPLLMNITQLINIVPRNLTVTGFRGVTGTGQAEERSFIAGAYSFMSPLRLAFDSSIINFNPQQVNIEEKYRDDIEYYLVSAAITAHYINHLPFGLAGELKIESPNTNPVTLPFQVFMPEIDERTGLVSAPKDTIITIALDPDQTNIFKQNQIFATASLFLPRTDTVSVTARDYFSIDYSYGKLKLNLLK